MVPHWLRAGYCLHQRHHQPIAVRSRHTGNSDPYSHADAYPNSNSDGYSYCYGNSNSDSHSDPDVNSNIDTKASPYTAASLEERIYLTS